MKYFLIAGEASGDLHASNLMKGLLASDPEAEFRFIGGDRMTEVAPGGLIQHFRNMNYMGVVMVIRNLGRLGAILRKTKKEISAFKPDLLVLVDYAGFNMQIAKFAHRTGQKVFYYISPKVWAWKKKRIELLRKYIDKVFVIFPFEPAYFSERGMEVEFHGNPLTDVIEEYRKEGKRDLRKEHGLDRRPLVALLAGSRRQELRLLLPVMRKTADAFPDYQFVVAGAPSCDPKLYNKYLDGSGIPVIFDATYDILDNAHAGVIASGTATLETALFNLPQVVIYKIGSVTYYVGRIFVKFGFFSLVNLIYGKELVKEMLQTRLVEKIRPELQRLLEDNAYREKIQEGYADIRSLVGEAGASRRAAARMTEILREGRR